MSTAPQMVAATTAIRNILFPTDFSAASSRAMPHALAIARQHNSTVHIVHVIKPAITYIGADSAGFECGTNHETCKDARKRLEALLTPQVTKEVHCEPTVSEGNLWECLARLIQVFDIDLVILGTKGAGGITKMMTGSDAEQLFYEAPCPVMTIGPHVKPDGKPQFKEILFALDFTEQCLRAYPYALEFVTESHGHMTVLHVVLPVPAQLGNCGMEEYMDMMRRSAVHEVNRATDFARHPVCPTVKVECGSPAKVIVEYARQLPADLVVMGVLHRGRFATHLPWMITHEVVSQASCPVLTVRS